MKYAGMTGAAIFHEMMREHGVDTVFGYPGGAILPVFDAIHESKHFNFYLTRHEQGAGHMAEGYARVTGKPGIVLVTSGPGATNTVTPMQDALMDGTPMIVFAGQVATSAIGTDAFQERHDRHLPAVHEVEQPGQACRGPPPRDQHRLPHRHHRSARPRVRRPAQGRDRVDPRGRCHDQVYLPGYHIREAGTSSEIEKAAEMINRAEKPVFYVGQGAVLSGAHEVLAKCAREANIPVTTTLQGLGAFDERDPLSLHMLGMHGSAYANWAMHDSDCIIAVGARFDDRVTGKPPLSPPAPAAEREGRGGIIHFDIAPENINKAVPVTIGVEGDARKNLELLQPLLEHRAARSVDRAINQWKASTPSRSPTTSGSST